MKLEYLIISKSPETIIKFFYEEKGRYGEFYINFTREARDANNPESSIGIRGKAEVWRKDKDYANDLLQGLAEELNRPHETLKLANVKNCTCDPKCKAGVMDCEKCPECAKGFIPF